MSTALLTTDFICWAIASAFGIAFLFAAKDRITWPAVILKGITTSCIGGYGLVLLLKFGERSEVGICFIVGLFLASLGDILLATLQLSLDDGSPDGVGKLLDAGTGSPLWKRVMLGLTGVVFIISYFLQLVAFLRGVAANDDVTQYMTPFLLFFALPIIVIFLGGTLSKYRIPEVEANIFIIGVCFFLLTSALFAAASVFAFSQFQVDPSRASWIFVGAVLFVLSMIIVSLRYTNPEKYDSKMLRYFSRTLTFFGRMMLAACAFLF